MENPNNISALYVIHNPTLKITKIGISRNVENRLNTLINACGCKLELIYSSETIINAEDIEKIIHKEFDKYRGIGEWFKIDNQIILDFIKTIENKFIRDPIVTDYINGQSVDDLMNKYERSRQFIIGRIGDKLRQYKHNFEGDIIDTDFMNRIKNYRNNS